MTENQQTRNALKTERPTRFFKTKKTDYSSDGDVRAFKKVPILPTLKDLREENPFLKPNIVDGAYSDVCEYLGTQFHLLREDYVAPFRKGIQMFRQVYLEGKNMNRGTLRRIEGVNFYLDAYFDQPGRHRLPKSLVILRLSWADYNFVDWKCTNQLKGGCLLGISKDNFLTVHLAVVSQKQTPKLLQRGILVIEFLEKDPKPSSQERWLIMENASAYFEAYCHNLEVIRSMDPSQFPLQQYLARAECSVKPPSFLKVDQSLDFEPILIRKSSAPSESIEWPEQPQTRLNEQQYQALKSAFSRELCIIQGPPGTGKTFVALRIVEMLLLNRVTDHPILVVCYTNHALDQFLEGMLQYTKDIVRVGGSSKSEELKNYTLKELMNGSSSEKEQRHLLESDRDECERRVCQLTGHAILGDDEINLAEEGLEKFLQLTAPVVPQITSIGTPGGRPRRDANFLKDQDRGQIQRKRVSRVSQRLLQEEISRSRRDTIQQHLKEHSAKRPAAGFIKALREKVVRKVALGLQNKWRVYRDEHWRYMEEWAANYVTKCAAQIGSRGVYLSKDRAARLPFEEDIVLRAKAYLKARIAEIDEDLTRLLRKIRGGNYQQKKLQIVKSSRVLGMTTTGAAKYNWLLKAARPEIVIVEEAAEVLEAHLLASLTPSTKQLILIGDHQQLQPSTAVHRLATDFKMEVSLFERLVRNKVDFVKLQEQHRMRDEFLCLLVPHIYENYHSHSDVNEYPAVRGIASNMFFMKHSHKELADPHAHSKSNIFEAEIVVRLAYHFLQQDYKETEITILSTYRGQVAAIEEEISKFCAERGFSEMQDIETFRQSANGTYEIDILRVPVNPSLPISPFEGMRITTVDNYQGEENKIVIVSLVRSNDEAKIGFLSRENRVCVALSRAKHGLYCIGDIPLLANASPLWAQISRVMTERQTIGDGMQLICETHRNRKIVRTAQDFDEWSKRGCGDICAAQMACGHLCNKACHSVDSTHGEAYQCDQMCMKVHPCGHLCLKLCLEECGTCTASTSKELECGHTVAGRCCDDIKCSTIVLYDPPCGHIRIIPCGILGSPDLVCGKPVTLSRPCGHSRRASCDARLRDDDSCATCEARKGRRKPRGVR